MLWRGDDVDPPRPPTPPVAEGSSNSKAKGPGRVRRVNVTLEKNGQTIE